MIFKYIVYTLIAVFLISCQEESLSEAVPGKKVSVPLSVSVSKQASLPVPGTTDPREAIHSIYIIAFKNSTSHDLRTARFAYAAKAVQKSSGSYFASLFKSTDENDLYSLVVLTNVTDEQITSLSEGMTYSEIAAALYAASLHRFTAETPVQMFGIVNKGEGIAVGEGTTLGTISVMRAVARVDIGVGRYNELDGIWDLPASKKKFTLTDVEVWSPMGRYYYMPAWGNFSYTEDGIIQSDKASGSLEYSTTTSTVWKYSAADISTDGNTTYCKDVIYLPEAALAGYTTNQQVNRNKRTSIIIGGYYRDGSLPEDDTTKTYYRIDFTDAVSNAADGALFDILRNHLYRFSLLVNAPGAVSALEAWKLPGTSEQVILHVGVIPWENGGAIDATSDRSIRMDPVLSTLPEGVVMEADRNLLEVSETGGNISVAFSAASPVELVSVDNSDDRLKVTKNGEDQAVNGKMISRYLIKVTPQIAGQLAYSVSLNMKTGLQQYAYDRFTVNVQPSGKVLPVVTLGGRTWMAFNSCAKGNVDQLYLDKGVTVADMYATRWQECLGNMFQYRLKKAHVPWILPTGLSKGDINKEWTGVEVPCPEGYRMPTLSELKALLPDGIRLVDGSSSYSYTYNGESITARLLRASPYEFYFPDSRIKGYANYVTLTSNLTGAVMYIPFGGGKSASESDQPDSADPWTLYGITFWSQNSPKDTGNGRQFKKLNFSEGEGWRSSGTDSFLDGRNSLFYVRCIKN